jgi:hypothetical protein
LEELVLDVKDEDVWLASELVDLLLDAKLLASGAELVSELDSDDVCGFVLVVLVVKPPLLSLVPAPPPQADNRVAASKPTRRFSFSGLKLVIKYYLLHGATIDENGLG